MRIYEYEEHSMEVKELERFENEKRRTVVEIEKCGLYEDDWRVLRVLDRFLKRSLDGFI